jgi:regulatory protein YycI of two-component signal transduction system YycFG
MEWGRAKTILIVSFIVLNVLLAMQLFDSRQKVFVQNTATESFSQDIQRLMAEKRISVNTAMPGTVEQLEQITIRFADETEQEGVVKFDEPIPLSDPPGSGEFAQRLQLRIASLNMAEYQWDKHFRDAEDARPVHVFHQLYQGLPMFEVNLKLYHENGAVVAYERDRVEIVPGAEQKLISSYTAVSTLIENVLPDDSAIDQVELGYHGQLFNSAEQFLTPFWRVFLADGTVYFVHAINGAVEGPQPNEKKEQSS